jgi:hypothetical protein
MHHNLWSLFCTVNVIKLRRVSWTGIVKCSMKFIQNMMGRLCWKDLSGDLCVGGNEIWKRVSEKLDAKHIKLIKLEIIALV